MEAIELLTTRRSVLARDLADPGPTTEELNSIITAGLRVPDHGKIGPWRIQIVNKNGQMALGDLCARLYQAQHGAAVNERMLEFERNRLQRAPVLLAVTAFVQVPHNIPEIEQRLSGGALCMNILNAAAALGYGAQWLTEWPAFDPDVKTMLGHDSETDIIGFIYIGTPKREPKQRNRPGFEVVVTKWSGPGPE